MTYRLYRALRDDGADAELHVRDRHSTDPSVRVYRTPAGLGGWRERRRSVRIAELDGAITHRPRGYEPFSFPQTASGRNLLRALNGYDVVNLHWVAGFADFDAIRAVAASVPVVWTLHDMNPFTGGCHYDDRCGRYRIGCGACPQLGSESTSDLSSDIWMTKRGTFAAIPPGRLTFIAPSRWMAAAAEESPTIAGRPVRVIPNGIDLDCFHDRRSAADRARFGIAADAHVVLFMSQYLSNRRKGLDRLLAAMGRLTANRETVLLALGHEPPAGLADLRAVHVPFEHDDALVASACRAADVVAIPSVQDNLPNTAIEALACGTPVVASAVGGLREIIDDGTTGLLVSAEDAGAFAAALSRLLGNDALRAAMGRAGRLAAEQRYGLARCAEAYRTLFAGLC